ncbi:MAG: tetratricopeptide repeat protein, partial [Rhodospirillaceae bacterium]
MNRRDRRRQEKEARRQARQDAAGPAPSGSVVADAETAAAFNAALALQQAGRLAEAAHAWEALRQGLPDHDGVNVNLATVYWRLGRLDDGAAACRDTGPAGPLHRP